MSSDCEFETALCRWLAEHPQGRVVLAGGPRTGKTTIAEALQHRIRTRSTDALIGSYDFAEGAPAEVARWMAEPGPWLIEGVAAIRAARAYLQAVESAPCDLLVWLAVPFVERSQTQRGMAKGCETVFRQILPELEARGVEVWQE